MPGNRTASDVWSPVVSGHVAAGFENVAQVFADNAEEVGAGGASFAVSLEGATVVDLWCGLATETGHWNRHTVSSLFSATKALTSTCLVLLHHRGLLDVDAPVATYWPDFAASGKSAVTVRQLLSHSAGMVEIPGHEAFMDLDGTGWDERERIRASLAAATPAWEPGTAHGYHVVTFGYLAGALVELIGGVALPEFFDAEIARPWGLDLHIGVRDQARARMTQLIEPDLASPIVTERVGPLLASTSDPSTIAGRACLANGQAGVLHHLSIMGNSLAALNAGGGFGDGVGTARSLSDFYARLLQPDSAGLGAESVGLFTTAEVSGHDLVLGHPSAYGLGFQCNLELAPGVMAFGPHQRSFGHAGAGGQLGMADPDRGLAMAFLRSELTVSSPLCARLVDAVYSALPVTQT